MHLLRRAVSRHAALLQLLRLAQNLRRYRLLEVSRSCSDVLRGEHGLSSQVLCRCERVTRKQSVVLV